MAHTSRYVTSPMMLETLTSFLFFLFWFHSNLSIHEELHCIHEEKNTIYAKLIQVVLA